jgi:hypothetical protein
MDPERRAKLMEIDAGALESAAKLLGQDKSSSALGKKIGALASDLQDFQNESQPTIVAPGSDSHRWALVQLANFCGLDTIIYNDGGDREDYVLKKGDDALTLKIRTNRVDGAFMSLHVGHTHIEDEVRNLVPVEKKVEVDPAIVKEMQALLDEGKVIQAIKCLRAATGCALRDGKAYVDRMRGMDNGF